MTNLCQNLLASLRVRQLCRQYGPRSISARQLVRVQSWTSWLLIIHPPSKLGPVNILATLERVLRVRQKLLNMRFSACRRPLVEHRTKTISTLFVYGGIICEGCLNGGQNGY